MGAEPAQGVTRLLAWGHPGAGARTQVVPPAQACFPPVSSARMPGAQSPSGSRCGQDPVPPAPGALIPAPFLPLWQDRHPLSWAIAGLRGSKTGGQKVEPLERHKPRSGQDTTSGRRGPRPALAVQTLRNTHGGFLLNLPVNCTSNAQVHLEPVLSKSQTPYHFPHKYFRAQMGLSISRC